MCVRPKGRVPRPRELEVTVLAYAPHFLGLAAAAAAEKLKSNAAARLAAEAAAAGDGGNSDGPTTTGTKGADSPAPPPAVSSKTAGQKRSTKREPKEKGGEDRSASVPTGLSLSAVWPDEEAARKRIDVEKYRADPVRVS